MLKVASLEPENFRVELVVKILELIVALETRHEQSNTTIKVYEYSVGDETGTVLLNTQTELQLGSVYEITHAHTEAVDGYLRLYANEFKPSSTDMKDVNIQNNRSNILLERKVY